MRYRVYWAALVAWLVLDAAHLRVTGSLLDCEDSCEACSDVEKDAMFVADLFSDCNTCGGVKFTVECTLTDSTTENSESVAVEVEAGVFENIAGLYYITADCSRNIILTQRIESEDEDSKEVEEEVDVVLDTERVSVEDGARLKAVIPIVPDADPLDPLAPAAQPPSEETLECLVS